MTPFIAKFRYYLGELRYSLFIGVDLSTRFRLSISLLRFHGFNALHPRQFSERRAENYRIWLDTQPVELAMRPFTGDLFIFSEVLFGEGYWIPPEWRSGINTVVDLGSHIGLTTLYLSAQFPQARFVCVEPSLDNFILLQRNLSSIANRAILLNAAVGCESGEAHFDEAGASWQGHIAGAGENGTKVKCYLLNDIMEIANFGSIDLIKIDIEGGEDQLFQEDTAWLRLTRVIMIEIHKPYSLDRFCQLMTDNGFEVFLPGSAHGNRVITAVSKEKR